jgi:predicted dienelactone hydrolase
MNAGRWRTGLPLRSILIVAALLAAAATARAAGYQEVTAPDPGHPPITIGIWYPSDAPVSDQRLELFHQSVAPDGAVTAGTHPMVVISHGQAGSLAGHYDTALALAGAGYVVVALTHTGDNWRDQSNVLNIMDRARQVHSVIDYMLADWPDHGSIDPARIGLFGYSAGGFTGLVAIGGKPDLGKVGPYCADHAEEFTCTLVAAHGGSARVAGPAVADPRIKAAVIAAPALGFTFVPDGLRGVTIPVQLWRADDDHVLPAPNYADAVRTALPNPPDFEPVPIADHFDFLAPCNAALAKAVPVICKDPPDFDRTAFHQRLNASMIAFFNRTLPAR